MDAPQAGWQLSGGTESAVIFSMFFRNWKEALTIVKPETLDSCNQNHDSIIVALISGGAVSFGLLYRIECAGLFAYRTSHTEFYWTDGFWR